MLRPTYAEIDLSAIRDNIRAIRARVGPRVKIMPAVKANGYGHGAVEVSRAVLQAGAEVLSVAMPEEGIELREAGFEVPILILGCSNPDAAGDIVRYDLASAACDLPYARAVSEAAVKQGRIASVHVKVDTGMGRIGVQPEEALDFVLALRSLRNLSVDGVFTHFPSADETDRAFTTAQIATFSKVTDALKRHGLSIPAHASNSGGVLAYPEADFDAVRPGIMIYGSYPSFEVVRSIPIREAMTLKTRIIFLKEADAGLAVSYGRTHSLKRRSKVATLPIGYADGYQRALSNRGDAAVRGVRVPVIGRVCMDQIIVDVTEVPGVELGDEVILIGGEYDYLSANEVGAKAGTISDETFCAITSRVPRVYING
jgi:alanine racemase